MANPQGIVRLDDDAGDDKLKKPPNCPHVIHYRQPRSRSHPPAPSSNVSFIGLKYRQLTMASHTASFDSSRPGFLPAVLPTTCRPVCHSSRYPIHVNDRRCFGDNQSKRSQRHRTGPNAARWCVRDSTGQCGLRRAIQRTTRRAGARTSRKCRVHDRRRQGRPPDDRFDEVQR